MNEYVYLLIALGVGAIVFAFGFSLGKERLKAVLREEGYDVIESSAKEPGYGKYVVKYLPRKEEQK